MTETQEKEYEYCKKHLNKIEGFKEKLPHNFQMYGCGQGQPNIEHSLDKIHSQMHADILNVYNSTAEKIKGIKKSI
jgi:hypothetical protein